MSSIQDSRRLVIPVTLVVIALSVLSLFRSTTSDPFQEQRNLYYEVMARQVIRVCERLAPDAPVCLMAFESEVETPEFKHTLRRLEEEGMSVQHVEGLVDTGGAQWAQDRLGFPYGEFLRVAGDYPDLKAVVSLCGTPFRLEDIELPDPASLPALLVTGDVEAPRRLNKMLTEGRVTAALVPRADPLMKAATDPAQLLDRDYEMLHAPAAERGSL